MIEIKDKLTESPYQEFYKHYNNAFSQNQRSIEAITISSWDPKRSEVNSRVVNLKYINKDEWIFFSNYDSPKMSDFLSHNQISALFFWEKINLQIRIKAKIYKSPKSLSDKHFKNRSKYKNALAISSKQSNRIDSYKDVITNYESIIQAGSDLTNRPSNWGGISFKPYYFEFWEGHKNRLNKRTSYEITQGIWSKYYLQP